MTEKLKTGTTCIGMLYKDGVILAADMRTTAGYIASENSNKIYNISNRILATTAGHAADNQLFMRIIQSELKLLELKTERKAKVREAAMILNSMQYSAVRSQGSIVSLIIGGYDEKEGFSLYNLGPDGTILEHDGFVLDGSGSWFIKGLVDAEYRSDLSEKEALTLIEKLFKMSFKNDNNSGGGFIARIVTRDGIKEVAKKKLKTELVNN